LCLVKKIQYEITIYRYLVNLSRMSGVEIFGNDSGPSASSLDKGLTPPPHRKKTACYEMLHGDSELMDSCEHGNELSGAMKGGEFLD
jgi:hypothetical protein